MPETYECEICKLFIPYGSSHVCRYGKLPPRFKTDAKLFPERKYNRYAPLNAKPSCKFCGTRCNKGTFAIFRLGNGEYCCQACKAAGKLDGSGIDLSKPLPGCVVDPATAHGTPVFLKDDGLTTEVTQLSCKFCGATGESAQLSSIHLGTGELCCPRCAAGAEALDAHQMLSKRQCAEARDKLIESGVPAEDITRETYGRYDYNVDCRDFLASPTGEWAKAEEVDKLQLYADGWSEAGEIIDELLGKPLSQDVIYSGQEMLDVVARTRIEHEKLLGGYRGLFSRALRAICLTRDYVQPKVHLPAKEGWEWYDAGKAIAEAIPHDEWAREFRSRVAIYQHDAEVANSIKHWTNNINLPLDTPIADVTKEFLEMFGFTGWEQERLINRNVVRITDKILTDADKEAIFNEEDSE